MRLVDDLLDVARIARGKLELSRGDVDLADVVAAGIETASRSSSSAATRSTSTCRAAAASSTATARA